MIYKRGKVYYYDFLYKGERYQKSTKQGNAQVARDIQAADRLKLIKSEHGIEHKEKLPCPTFMDFKGTFMEWYAPTSTANGRRSSMKPASTALRNSENSAVRSCPTSTSR